MSRRSPKARRTVASSASRPSRRRIRVVALALVALLVLGIGWRLTRPPAVPPRPTFSGDRAVADVERQVAFGARVPGTPAHAATRRWLVTRLDSLGASVSEQAVAYTSRRAPVRRFEGVNIVASTQPDAARRILLAAHWDSRATADEDPNPARRSDPVPGANDGASGVAVLLEIARLLQDHPLPQPVGVDLVLFDLEDIGEPNSQVGTVAGGAADSLRIPFAVGSRAFVAANPRYRPQFGILLDMVGDADLRIPKEAYSARYAAAVMDRIWAAARRVGATAFVEEPGPPIEDDHLAFLQVGIPVVDLIHAPFPSTWHTTADTPDRVRAASLQQVGDVLVELLWAPGGVD